MAGSLQLPIVDLSSSDRASTATSIRQGCLEYGFFYLINHGLDDRFFDLMLDQSRKFFELPHHEKMRLKRNTSHRGYTPPYSEVLDPSSNIGVDDFKESFYIGSLQNNNSSSCDLNQWPPEEALPVWRKTMVSYYESVLSISKKLISLISLSLNLSEDFFDKYGAFRDPVAFLRLLHYPDHVLVSDKELIAASAHSDYGMITLLICDGVPGLQICREKDKHPRIWEDVHHVPGAFVVNAGDLLERWTNCLFRSTLHRVVATGKERYSAAVFFDPNPDCIIECLETCCDEACPPRFPPIKAGEYLYERLTASYGLTKLTPPLDPAGLRP